MCCGGGGGGAPLGSTKIHTLVVLDPANKVILWRYLARAKFGRKKKEGRGREKMGGYNFGNEGAKFSANSCTA